MCKNLEVRIYKDPIIDEVNTYLYQGLLSSREKMFMMIDEVNTYLYQQERLLFYYFIFLFIVLFLFFLLIHSLQWSHIVTFPWIHSSPLPK
jgi:hypothetical protein